MEKTITIPLEEYIQLLNNNIFVLTSSVKHESVKSEKFIETGKSIAELEDKIATLQSYLNEPNKPLTNAE